MNKRDKKIVKRIIASLKYWGWAAGAIVLLLAFGVFLFLPNEQASVYISSDNPKQGDTVFIRVKTEASEITGNFGVERLVFYKKGLPAQSGNLKEWIAFLGIDADHNPGDYKIFVDTSNAEHLVKDIKVGLADFSVATATVPTLATQNGITGDKAVSNIRNNDNPALQKVLSNLTPKPYFSGPFSSPLSTMQTSGFSFGKFVGLAKYKLQHFGVDLKAPEKTDIFAINNGKVVATLDLSNYGKTVIIDHGLDIFSLYLHLEKFNVANGQMVRRGELIGLSGDTGYSSAPHLHFSIRVGGSRVDPIAFIETSKKLNDTFFTADLFDSFSNIIKLFK